MGWGWGAPKTLQVATQQHKLQFPDRPLPACVQKPEAGLAGAVRTQPHGAFQSMGKFSVLALGFPSWLAPPSH